MGLIDFNQSSAHSLCPNPGCNVENCAYPLSTCAERVAITKAKSEGMCDGDTLLAVACATLVTTHLATHCILIQYCVKVPFIILSL